MSQSRNRILNAAKALDDALETRDIEQIVSFFSDDCEIELLGITLSGKNGVRKWLNWMFQHLTEIRLEPVIIMVKDNVFLEEFVVHATLYDGTMIQSKQAEVLIYENFQVKSLRLYFDRLDFGQSIVKGSISRLIVRRLINKSLEGLR